jgi:elongation factor 1-gamma
MRAVARLGAERFPVYGRNVYESSRVDAFLDASLVFARDSQIYLLALSDGLRRATSMAG